MIEVSEILETADLESLVADINGAAWDAGNDMSDYEASALRLYLASQDTVFIACYETGAAEAVSPQLMGIASARFQLKPYGHERWLYVDEVDVCADQRNKGAGRAMMHTLLAIARERGCDELWLGTETDNAAANALYRSISPDEEESFVGYAWELKRG